jgi:hypothetical protein
MGAWSYERGCMLLLRGASWRERHHGEGAEPVELKSAPSTVVGMSVHLRRSPSIQASSRARICPW